MHALPPIRYVVQVQVIYIYEPNIKKKQEKLELTFFIGKVTLLAGCLSTCQDVERACGLVFTLMNQTQLLPDCNATSPITKAPLQSDDSCNLIPPTGRYPPHTHTHTNQYFILIFMN
jgi:hypothetical protein